MCFNIRIYVKEHLSIDHIRKGGLETRPNETYLLGANRNRTCDFLLAKQALSQLSYSPSTTLLTLKMGLDRVELSTPSLSEKCSNQLSYRPKDYLHSLARAGSKPALITNKKCPSKASMCVTGLWSIVSRRFSCDDCS